MPLRNPAPEPVPLERMERLPRFGDLEIDEDMHFQRRFWALQRVGTAVLALVLAFSLTGLLGGVGPLNARSLRSGEVTVEVERVVRHSGVAHLAVEVPPSLQRDGTFRVWIDRSWWQGMALESDPLPAAQSAEVAGDLVLYQFAVLDPSKPSRVEFETRPDDVGLRRGAVGVVGGPSVSFTQFVVP